MNILWLGQTECHDISRVGGKTANLSRLAADYPVPAGFCLAADVFEQVDEAALPDSITRAVTAAYDELGSRCGRPQPAVAVRSSAVDEDSPDASFAGQFETFLNVSGAEAVVQSVRRCWQSALSERVQAYRQERGYAPDSVRMAVLVQQLVPADVSAVVFSANPVTGERGEVLINAGWGLGESIVGGTVTPDTFVVRKADMTVVSRDLSDKQRMTVLASGGVEEVAVPRFLRQRPSLDEEQVIEMARLALDLEQHMGWPVDLECAYREEELYLLQCRPITALGGGG